MQFTLTDEIPYPRDLVYATHRDKLLEVAEYLTNVEDIDVRNREEDGDIVRFENWWTGSSNDVPRVLQGFLKPEMLVWVDRATWDKSKHRVDWEITLNALPQAVTAKGYNLFDDEGDVTVIRMHGEFIVHPEKVKGIPTFVAKRAAPTIEKFVVGLLEPNLRESNRAVESYLDDNA